MKATVLHGAGDVRVEEVPDAKIIESTDAVIRIYRACICNVGADVQTVKAGDLAATPLSAPRSAPAGRSR
jgi:threonine dehydrogenase-like Zn-dependent dehydrogenase